ncbi:MAG: sensor domain-containing diguanylate cyclase [Spirochaetaceae bacterium]|nr:sensor domain-containing diguanylate cyclase [Spirochaetaceae bacterium]
MTSDEYEKQIFDLQQLLEISRSLCSTLQFSTLIGAMLDICMGQMHTLGSCVFIMDSFDSDSFKLSENYNGMNVVSGVNYVIPFLHPVVEKLNEKEMAYTFEELSQGLPDDDCMKMIASLKPTLIIPLQIKKNLNGILMLGERLDLGEGTAYSDYEKKMIISIASLAAIAINNSALVERSSTDLMTHLKQRYYFFNMLADALSSALEQKSSISVVMFDIDHFKSVNDTYGHACGDYVLQEVSKIIRESIRGEDVAGRYGGEEFTVLLRDTDIKGGLLVAERIRMKVERKDFRYENKQLKLTISAGVTAYDGNISSNVPMPKQFVDFADKAMYNSKKTGRNKVSYMKVTK